MQKISEPTDEPKPGTTMESGTENFRKAEFIPDATLFALNLRTPLHSYVAQLWARRFFIRRFSRASAFSTGRNTFLGKVWILLEPLFQVAMYALIFGFILRTDRGIDNFIGFLVLGVIFFKVASRGITAGAGLIQANRALITSFHFPRASVAFSTTLKSFYDNLAPCFLAVVIAVLFQLDKPLSWTIICVVPIYFLLHIFSAGTTLISARLTAFIPDMKQVISIGVRGLFFVSGIFFSIERFDHHQGLQTVMQINPIYQFLRAVRLSVLDGQIPSMSHWLYLLVWAIGIFVVGLLFFWRAEARYVQAR